MNPLTQVKQIQILNAKESELGISEEASWHAKYKNSAYVYIGLLPYELTEGDLLAIFAQYGEIVDLNLIRDKGTGKSKGFAFLAYEDQRSTILAVDNLNGAQVLGRTIRVDHRGEYKKHEEEDEDTKQQKREARGVCRAFQRGECTRGDSCKFSHDEKRAANTGWGHEEDRTSKWDHDKSSGAHKGSGPRRDAQEKNYRGKDHGDGRRKERDDYDRSKPNRREGERSRTHDRESEREREGQGSSRHTETYMRQDRDSSKRRH